MTIIAEQDDRLDLIARRAYPNADLNDAMRTLIWANTQLSLEDILAPPPGAVLNNPDIQFNQEGPVRPLI